MINKNITNGKEIEVVLKIKLSTIVENILENDKDTLRYMVEEDLSNKKLGYNVESVEILE